MSYREYKRTLAHKAPRPDSKQWHVIQAALACGQEWFTMNDLLPWLRASLMVDRIHHKPWSQTISDCADCGRLESRRWERDGRRREYRISNAQLAALEGTAMPEQRPLIDPPEPSIAAEQPVWTPEQVLESDPYEGGGAIVGALYAFLGTLVVGGGVVLAGVALHLMGML